MRVLYLAPNVRVPGTNGGATHVTCVTRALRDLGHEVLLVTRRGSSFSNAIAVGIGNPPALRNALPFYYFVRTYAQVREFGPDVIYERDSARGLGVLFRQALGVPSVLMTLDRDASAAAFRYADRIVATSDTFIPARHHHKLRLLHWGADAGAFADSDGAATPETLNADGRHVVLYTGACFDWHGLDILVDVARRWTGPPVLFVVAGSGEALRRLRRSVAAHRLEDRFAFTGSLPHDRIPALVAAASVCVAPYAPSRHPIFAKHGMDRDPLKLLEYMAAGRPAVTIRTTRLMSLFEDGREVVFYEAEDADSLHDRLLGLLSDPDRAEAIGRAGAALVRSRFTWREHARGLAAVFEEAVASRRA